jgi:uncharacterized protein (DUF1810 family)
MIDKFNLSRFLDAQIKIYEIALNEIKRGNKSSHWMWYIFPQYKGLGYSSTAQKYAITCVEEASMYFKHPILGRRLIEITNAFFKIENKSAYEILGDPDYLKMKSCMTLFKTIQTESEVFSQLINKYYSGSECSRTISQTKLLRRV